MQRWVRKDKNMTFSATKVPEDGRDNGTSLATISFSQINIYGDHYLMCKWEMCSLFDRHISRNVFINNIPAIASYQSIIIESHEVVFGGKSTLLDYTRTSAILAAKIQ